MLLASLDSRLSIAENRLEIYQVTEVDYQSGKKRLGVKNGKCSGDNLCMFYVSTSFHGKMRRIKSRSTPILK